MIKTGLIQINVIHVCTKCYGFSFYLVNVLFKCVHFIIESKPMLQLYLKNKNKFAQMIGEDVFIDPSLDYT